MADTISEDNTQTQAVSLFQRPLFVAIFALTAAILWGWAYPLIKLGFGEFGITRDMTGGKILFAGTRFFLSGVIILIFARANGKPFALRRPSDCWFMLLFALLNTTIHYICFYIGLSYAEGARSAIINSLSVFSVVILACVFFKSDKMSWRKVVGCAMGFGGILSLNLGNGSDGGHFTMLGDGMIILNALSSATASLLTREMSHRANIIVGTGYSLAVGGFLLIVIGLLLGGTLPKITPLGVLYWMLLVMISSLAFILYNRLIIYNPVGKVAIYNSLMPVVGVLTSCMCLGETFHCKYAIATILVALGIYIINKGKR